MECIIKEKVISDTFTAGAIEAEREVASILGEQPRKMLKTVRYEDTITHEEYLCLAGGFAWPGMKPGFVVIVAAQRHKDAEEVIFKTIAEVEEQDLNGLLRRSYELFQTYGRNCRETPWFWYGNSNSGLNEFIQKFNKQQEQRGDETSFFLAPPPYLAKQNSFEIYCRTIHSFLQGNAKRLILGSCDKLRAYLDQLITSDIVNGAIEEHPAISALGFALAALDTYEPWLMELVTPITEEGEFEGWYGDDVFYEE